MSEMLDDDPKTPEVLSAALALFLTFFATVVLHICVISAYFWMVRHKWIHVSFLYRVVWFVPFVVMMYPGVRRLLSRQWVVGVLLLIGGWLLAFPALWLALGLIWKGLD
jgi:hypothetical protein